jgi:hypothetical protein
MIFLRVPESPRWLVSKGRHAEALAVLAALDGTTVDDPLVQKTWRGIVDAVRHSAGDFALKELFTHGKSQHFRRTMLGVAAQVSRFSFRAVPCSSNLVFPADQWYQVSLKVNQNRTPADDSLITYYLTSVLEDMDLGPEMSRIIAGVNGTVYFLTSYVILIHSIPHLTVSA